MYIATPTAAAAVTALGYFNSLFTNSGNSGSPMVAGGALATALSATGLGSVTAYAYDQSTGTAKAVPTVVG